MEGEYKSFATKAPLRKLRKLLKTSRPLKNSREH